jgi:rubrerythrin
MMAERGFDAARVLEAAEELERAGEAFYREAAEAVSDKQAKSLLLALAAAEVRHLRVIERIRAGLEKSFPVLSHGQDVSDLATRFKELLFPEDPSNILSDTRKPTEIQALERGVRLERESIELYEDAADRGVDPGVSNAFRRLVMEERIHLFVLNQRLDVLKLRS